MPRSTEGVERREDAIEVVDQNRRGDLRRHLREPDQIGEQDGRLLDPIGDHDLAIVETRDDLAGQDVAQQDLVFLPLQLDPFQVAALAIAPALALQAGADPRPQQDGVERLRQIVLCAALDAPDHAVGLLQAGDHDHRDVVQPLIGFEAFQHLETVQLGHQEIKQDEVELLDRENLQRPAARILLWSPDGRRGSDGGTADRGCSRCRRPPEFARSPAAGRRAPRSV